MEHNYNNQEQLDELRSQLKQFKEKLDRQEIVNDQLMRTAISDRMSWIRHFIWFEVALLFIIPLIWIPLKSQLHISWWNIGFLFIMCCIDVWLDYKINILRHNQVQRESLLETTQKLITMKKQRKKTFFIMLGSVFVWVIWLLYEVSNKFTFTGLEALQFGAIFGITIGAFIGIIASIVIFIRMQQTNNRLIKELKTFNEEA